MTMLAIGLFLLAVILLIAEGYTTGFGAFGIPGLLSLGAAIFLTVVFVPFGIFVVVGVIAALVPLSMAFVRYLRKKQMYGRLILSDVLAEDKSEVKGLEFFVGKEGITKTALRPYGSAEFNGSKVDVYSDSKYIEQNRRIKVVDVRDNKVYVKLVDGN